MQLQKTDQNLVKFKKTKKCTGESISCESRLNTKETKVIENVLNTTIKMRASSGAVLFQTVRLCVVGSI